MKPRARVVEIRGHAVPTDAVRARLSVLYGARSALKRDFLTLCNALDAIDTFGPILDRAFHASFTHGGALDLRDMASRVLAEVKPKDRVAMVMLAGAAPASIMAAVRRIDEDDKMVQLLAEVLDRALQASTSTEGIVSFRHLAARVLQHVKGIEAS